MQKSGLGLIVMLLSFPLLSASVHAENIAGDEPRHHGKSNDGPLKSLDSIPANSPLSKAVKENLPKCGQKLLGSSDCRIEDLGQIGDAAHKARHSCHNLRPPEAWDIGKIHCGGKTLDPKVQKDPFLKFTECVVHGGETNQGNGGFVDKVTSFVSNMKSKLAAIFSKPGDKVRVKPNHDNHMHVEIEGCMARAGGGGSSSAQIERMPTSLFARILTRLWPVEESVAEASSNLGKDDFIKTIDAIGVGKLRLEFRRWGEPLKAPATLKVFLKCDGSSQDILVSETGTCEMRSINYNKQEKRLSLSVMSGRVDNSAVFCDVAEETELDMAKVCRSFWRQRLDNN